MTDPEKIVKRNGDVVDFDRKKIANAILKANNALPEGQKHTTEGHILLLTEKVVRIASKAEKVTVEAVQDIVERVLIEVGLADLAKAYILYRQKHARIREAKDFLMETFHELTYKDASDVDIKRENANIDADTAMGTMLKYGSTAANFFVDNYILPKDISDAHRYGAIHIHDKDFFLLTETCCQIDLLKLLKDGFQTGHGTLREPTSINTAAALSCIAIQSNQNDQHGGQAVPHFDYCMAPYVQKTYDKEYINALNTYKELTGKEDDSAIEYAENKALERTDHATYQAMEALVHNLNTMNSRAGAQCPFSSINYGTDISWQGRMVIKNLLLATQAGLGNGETPIFPVQIFKVKEGVNYNPEDPNYDLFKLAMETSAKRLFPNFSFLDAPFNKAFYTQPGDWNHEVAYMGCFQKDEVITYKVNDILFVESGERAFNRLSDIFPTRTLTSHQSPSDYISTQSFDVKVYDSHSGGFVKVKKWIRNEEPKDGWKLIKLTSGRNLVLTNDHYLPVEGKGRTAVSDLQIGDEIQSVWSQYSEDLIDMSTKKAWLLGMILCDGAYSTNIVISVGSDEKELVDCIDRMARLLSYTTAATEQNREERGHYWDVRINTGSFKESRKRLTALFGGEKKSDRHIPNQVFSWSHRAKIAFLAGMFDADGHVELSHDKTFALVLGSTNKELAIQQMLLFQALGVRSRIYRNHYKSRNAGAIRYAVYAYPDAEFVKNFCMWIECKKKRDRLQEYVPSKVIESNFICKVESISPYVEHDFCYDLETESDRFDLSGVCSHNCRTRVMANVDKEHEVTCGRGNLSFTTINLPRLGILAGEDHELFFKLLDDRIDLVIRQLLHRYKIQGRRKVKNYPFLMGNGIWIDSDKLDWDDPIESVIKHGTLTIGFIGLAECLVALTGKHHGESDASQELGLKIIGHMRKRCDEATEEYHQNWSLLGTPAEGLAGRFVPLDRKRFGEIPGINDRPYYTNSFHVPVYYPIKAFKKIEIEAPYHEFTNGGHITYVELAGDTARNLDAFEKIVRYMHDCGVGYGSINHPVDRDPVCGYVGVIGDVCPRCGRREGESVPVEKLRELRKQYSNVPKY